MCLALLESAELVERDFVVMRVRYRLADSYHRDTIGFVEGHVMDGGFYVDDIKCVGGKGGLGVRGVREIVRQLDKDWGPLRCLIGVRITGARDVAFTPRSAEAKFFRGG